MSHAYIALLCSIGGILYGMSVGAAWHVYGLIGIQWDPNEPGRFFMALFWPVTGPPVFGNGLAKLFMNRPEKLKPQPRKLPETIEGVVEYRKLKGLVEKFEKSLSIGERGS